MRRQPLSMKRSMLLFAFVLFFFATTIVAQTTATGNDDVTTTADATDGDETDTPTQTDADEATTTTADSDATTTTDADDEATTTTDNDDATTTTTTGDNETTTTDDSTTEATTTTAESTATSTDATTTSEATTTARITTGSTSVPPLPTLAGQYSYPAPSVPPTDNAPFMKPNKVPEGTFFIAVGAVLGAFGAAILLWRAVVAWQLHRSVKRAALAQQMSNDKLSYAAPPAAPFYKYTDRESSPSLANASTGRGVRRTTRGPIPSSTPSQTNLFFSPTAPGANSASNRESRFLPSGFYAAGAGGQPQQQQQQNHTHSISLTNLRPDSRGHARAVGHSPPDSPSLAPREPARRNMSTSTLNLNRPTSGRAPSAYLDDLLADQPEQFPPPQYPTPNRNSTWSQSPQNSQHRH